MDSRFQDLECRFSPLTSKECSSTLLQDFLCFKTGSIERHLNVADALSQPQNTDLFLSGSLHFLQRCLEKRLNSLKPEEMQSKISVSYSDASLYSCGKVMNCLNGRSDSSLGTQEALTKIPAITEYEEKIKHWSSFCQRSVESLNSSERKEELFKEGKEFSVERLNSSETKEEGNEYSVERLNSSERKATLIKERKDETVILSNISNNTACKNVLDEYSDRFKNAEECMRKSIDDLMEIKNTKSDNFPFPRESEKHMRNEFNANTINSSELEQFTQCKNKSIEPINTKISASETCNSVKSKQTKRTKLSSSVMNLINRKKKSEKRLVEEIVSKENSAADVSKNVIIFDIPEEISNISRNSLLKKSKGLHKVVKQRRQEEQLSPGTISRLQDAILKVFKSNKSLKTSRSNLKIRTDTKIKKKKDTTSKKSLISNGSIDDKKTVCSQTSQIFICGNTESQSSNSYISLTETVIDKLISGNYVKPCDSVPCESVKIKPCDSVPCESVKSKDKLPAVKANSKLIKMSRLKVYKMPHMMACTKCKRYHNRKYRTVATSTDNCIANCGDLFKGCPHCNHCASSSLKRGISYLSRTISRSFETKVDLGGGEEHTNTAFSFESRNSSKTTLYMDNFTNENPLQSSALSRILKEIIREQKRKSPHTISHRRGHRDKKHKSNVKYMEVKKNKKNKKKPALKQLSKLSVCDDEVQENISDYRMPFNLTDKLAFMKPDLNLVSEKRSMNEGVNGPGLRVDAGIPPTSPQMNVTIENHRASSPLSPPELAGSNHRSWSSIADLLEMCKLPSPQLVKQCKSPSHVTRSSQK